jgi:hypothetical protein
MRLALALLLLAALPACAALPAPVFAARPRVSDVPKADAALLAKADALAARGLTVPTGEGDWIFYYACPKDGARLRPETPERHACPTCRAVYTDKRTVAAYKTLLNEGVNADCLILAQAYATTGDAKYARPVRAALLALAADYPTLTHHDRWGRRGMTAVVGGWRYAQLLDEAVSLIALSKAYDLVADAPCFTADDRKTVETAYLADIAHRIRTFQTFVGVRCNHMTWFNAAYATVGLAIGDAALLREAIEGKAGLLWQLDHSVTVDGLWYEGTMSYHFYALMAIEATLEAAARAGWTFRDDTRLQGLWRGPAALAYPNGQFPTFHDSDPAGLANYGGHFAWATAYFQDPAYAALVGKGPATSADLRGIGIATLRRAGRCVMVDYGPHGDHHGHPDKLNITLFANNREVLADVGRISYSVPEYTTWARTSVAHNTVILDGADQRPDTGQCLYFADTPAFAACLVASDGAYPGTALRRLLVLTDTCLVDVFTVKSARVHRIDWAVHARGTLTTDPPLAPRTEPLGTKAGYQHLTDLREGRASRFTLALDHHTYAILTCDDDGTVVTGTGIGSQLHERVPFILRRREARDATFITVYDLTGTAVRAVSRTPTTNGVTLRLETPAGPVTMELDLRDPATGERVVMRACSH